MQPFNQIFIGALAVVAFISARPRASAADGAIAGIEFPPLPPPTLAQSGEVTTSPDVGVPGATEIGSPPSKEPGDPSGGQAGGGNAGEPGKSVRPEPPPASVVGALLRQFNDQRRWQREALANKTQSAMSALRRVDSSERRQARAAILAQAGADRAALLASQSEARIALMAELDELRSQRRERQDLVEAAKERGLEASRIRHGDGSD